MTWSSLKQKNPLTEDNYLPKVSFIIAAYNEEKVIADKIKNTLMLNYPKDKLEIIIVSDGSDDKTHEIAKRYKDIIALHQPERRGKSAALNRAITYATGEILVLSDANNDYQRDAIRELVKHFSDEHVGAVTGAKRIYEESERQSSVGDGAYWRYESAIKQKVLLRPRLVQKERLLR